MPIPIQQLRQDLLHVHDVGTSPHPTTTSQLLIFVILKDTSGQLAIACISQETDERHMWLTGVQAL